MKKIAIEKARVRLERARRALEAVALSTNHADFESAWTDVLAALNTIMVCLEKGASVNPQSRQWFGGIKKTVRQDPLLRYLIQARNADEHGLEPVSYHDPHLAIGTGIARDVYIHNASFDERGNFSLAVSSLDGKPVEMRVIPPHAALTAVKDDRFGDTFDPPTEHLGQPLEDVRPYSVAEKAVAYYAALIEEAAARVP